LNIDLKKKINSLISDRNKLITEARANEENRLRLEKKFHDIMKTTADVRKITIIKIIIINLIIISFIIIYYDKKIYINEKKELNIYLRWINNNKNFLIVE